MASDSDLASLHASLRRLWSEILETEVSGTSDSFFELGGDSLEMITMLFAAAEKYDADVDFEPFLENPTIEFLAILLSGQKSS